MKLAWEGILAVLIGCAGARLEPPPSSPPLAPRDLGTPPLPQRLHFTPPADPTAALPDLLFLADLDQPADLVLASDLLPAPSPCGTCADPCPISGAGGIFVGTMSGSGSIASRCYGSGADAVHAWTPVRSGTATLLLEPTYWPAGLHVDSPGCGGGQIGGSCAMDPGPWPHMSLSFSVTAGRTYLLVADSDYNAVLGYTLIVIPP